MAYKVHLLVSCALQNLLLFPSLLSFNPFFTRGTPVLRNEGHFYYKIKSLPQKTIRSARPSTELTELVPRKWWHESGREGEILDTKLNVFTDYYAYRNYNYKALNAQQNIKI